MVLLNLQDLLFLVLLVITSVLFTEQKHFFLLVSNSIAISKDGRLTAATYMAEYNQDRFELDIIAKETQSSEREAKARVYVSIIKLKY